MNEAMNLSSKEQKRRNFILNGNLFRVVLTLTAPLAVYSLFNYLYGFFDMIMVAHIGSDILASVVFIDEIKTAITAFGGGIAAAGTVFVAREYGAGKIEEARKNAGASLGLAILVSGIVVALTLLFGRQSLLLLNAPPEVVDAGLGYFNLQMMSTALIAVNGVFIGLEKAKGNTRLILIVNIAAMSIKLALSAWFVYGLGKGAEFVALATLIAQGILTVMAVFVMTHKKNSLRIGLKGFTFSKKYVLPILILALPVFIGKFLFSFGKVLVNSMAAVYGTGAIAAFGLAMKLGGGPSAMGQVFEESETTIVSQNLGNRDLKRAVRTGRIAIAGSAITSLIGMGIVALLLNPMVSLFVKESEPGLRQMTLDIFAWEQFSALTSGLIAVTTGFFIGFKVSKMSFFINIIRIFVFRFPVLLLFQAVGVGYIALGYTMFVSNTATMIVGLAFFFFFGSHLKNFGYLDLHYQ